MALTAFLYTIFPLHHRLDNAKSFYMPSLKNAPFTDNLIHRGDARITPYVSDVVMTGDPDAVYRPSNTHELQEVVAYCNAHRIPITPAGNQTSLTGSSVALNGLLISTEKLDRLIDIDTSDPEHPRAIVEPGIFLADLQDTLIANGFHYPPDPTSRREARLGGTIATNANGEDSLLYGGTRHHIHALTVMKSDGTLHTLTRQKDTQLERCKNRAGYLLNLDANGKPDPLDLVIGSEGTLGLVTQATLSLIPNPDDHVAGITFFPSLASALRFVAHAMSPASSLTPRALELMDRACLNILAHDPTCFKIPETAEAALYFKYNFKHDSDHHAILEQWLAAFDSHFSTRSEKSLIDDTVLATTRAQKDALRTLRHRIPATMHERMRAYTPMGGGKVSTDWWVPTAHIEEAMAQVIAESAPLRDRLYLFGHIGNGHPHVNYITQTADEKQLAQHLVISQCKRAAAWGGGVAGEHGIGKLKHALLAIQQPSPVIARMRAIKTAWDPHWLLGQGNLFGV